MRRYNSNVLYHSDVYLGQDYSNGIQHWKYMKREWKNGRWVYYYKDAALDKAKSKENIMRKKYNAASKKVDAAFDKEGKTGSKLLGSKLDYAFNKDKFIKGKISKKRLDKDTKSYDAAVSERKKAVAERSVAGDNYHKATVNTKFTEQKDKVRKTLAKGAIKVANAQSEAGQKIKKRVTKALKKIGNTAAPASIEPTKKKKNTIQKIGDKIAPSVTTSKTYTSTQRMEDKKIRVPKNVSKEYLEEKAYNSKKNIYPETKKKKKKK